MPRRTISFQANAYYHIYNRGIENLTLFRDEVDYQAFLDSLAYYLVPFTTKPQNILARTGLAFNNTFSQRIALFAYALLPDSFHLLLHQSDHMAVVKFMQRACTAYSMYYNQKYTRKGTLFEGRFRTKLIDTDDYLLESTKYLHRLGLNSSENSEKSDNQSTSEPENQKVENNPTSTIGQFDNSTIQPSDSPAEAGTKAESSESSEPKNSPLGFLKSVFSSPAPSLPNSAINGDLTTPPSDNSTIRQFSNLKITSYPRYLHFNGPVTTPLSYIDLATKPDKPLSHFAATHPGQSYADYVEKSDNIDWYKGLLTWLA